MTIPVLVLSLQNFLNYFLLLDCFLDEEGDEDPAGPAKRRKTGDDEDEEDEDEDDEDEDD